MHFHLLPGILLPFRAADEQFHRYPLSRRRSKKLGEHTATVFPAKFIILRVRRTRERNFLHHRMRWPVVPPTITQYRARWRFHPRPASLHPRFHQFQPARACFAAHGNTRSRQAPTRHIPISCATFSGRRNTYTFCLVE